MPKGWFNLESGSSSVAGAAVNVIPDNQFFEGESAFKSFGLSRTTRLYGFVGWYVLRGAFAHLSRISRVDRGSA